MAAIIDEILGHEIYRDVDTNAIRNRYGRTDAIMASLDGFKTSPSNAEMPTTSISSIPPGGLVIKESGNYVLANDVVWSPSVSLGAAITIAVDGVKLDLGGHTLSIDNATPTDTLAGIAILSQNPDYPTLYTVEVKHGTVSGFTFCGLVALGTQGLILDGLSFTGGRYTNTTDADICSAGLVLALCEKVSILKTGVTDCEVTAPALAGIFAVGCDTIGVIGSHISGMTNLDGVCQGFSFLLTTNISQENCVAKDITTHYQGLTQTVGHTSIGYIYTLCGHGRITGCHASAITGCCDDAHGMSVFVASDFYLNNIYIEDVLDGPAPYNTGAKATGIEVYGTNVQLQFCYAKSIKAIKPQDLQAAGFSAWGADIQFTECQALTVSVTNPAGVPSTDLSYGIGVGFGWAPDPRPEFRDTNASSVTYKGCLTLDSHVGFDTWKHVSSRWISCEYSGAGIAYLEQPDGTVRTMTMDGCSESPTGEAYSADIVNTASDNRT